LAHAALSFNGLLNLIIGYFLNNFKRITKTLEKRLQFGAVLVSLWALLPRRQSTLTGTEMIFNQMKHHHHHHPE